MIAIPAVDLKDGKVVRLAQGRFEEFIVYSHDPLETAKSWQKQGAPRLHIIDLDGALAGEPVNTFILRQITEQINIPLQVGGGLRTKTNVDTVLSLGAGWAIIGTKACEDLDFIKNLVAEYGNRIIVSVDVKFAKVATRAWTATNDIDAVELIKKLQGVGVESFIYTDISRDGTLSGINIQSLRNVLTETGAGMIYSGGVSTLEDVKELKTLEMLGLCGIIIGKALYENKIHLQQANRILE